MVAYSFAPQFRDDVAALRKRQTVRGPRARHVRPGEDIQLYTAMRTKYCRKLVDPDPICRDVRPIVIDIAPRNPKLIMLIEIEGVALDDGEIEAFAVADGFGSTLFDGPARRQMGLFWLRNRTCKTFEGVVIRWDPRHG